MSARKFRIVPDCPQPEPPPYKPVSYGYTPERVRKLGSITSSPLPHEATIIARVQSMRTRGGVRAEPLSYEASVTYLRNVDRVRKRGVTVPRPLNASLSRDSATTPPPDVAAERAGAYQETKHERSRDPRSIRTAEHQPITAACDCGATECRHR